MLSFESEHGMNRELLIVHREILAPPEQHEIFPLCWKPAKHALFSVGIYSNAQFSDKHVFEGD